MKKKLWKKAAVALGFGVAVAGIGVGGNALFVNAEETDSNEPSTVQNTVLETPEMTKGYLHITSTVSDYDADKTWDRWDGYILIMQLTQSDLSSFTSFWWNIEAKGGAYASSVKDYTECFIGFQSAQGRNFIWGSPDWGDKGTDIVHYSPTFLGTEFGQTAEIAVCNLRQKEMLGIRYPQQRWLFLRMKTLRVGKIPKLRGKVILILIMLPMLPYGCLLARSMPILQLEHCTA